MIGEHMKYIRQRNNGTWQFRFYNENGKVSYTNYLLDEVITYRNNYLGYDPDEDERDMPIVENDKDRNDIFGLNTPVIGVIGDTHLGSKYERLDILRALYNTYSALGIKYVIHTGNMIEGQSHFNKNDIKVWGAQSQVDYCIEHYPKVDDIKTLFITADDHEGWWIQREGVNVGPLIANERNDMIYIGHMEHDILINDFLVRVIHAGGGSSKAVSLASQNIVDSYPDWDKPDILLIGHYHKAHYLPDYRGVAILQTGTTQEQTPFMRKKHIIATLGGWVLDVSTDSFYAQFLKHKANQWKYKMTML